MKTFGAIVAILGAAPLLAGNRDVVATGVFHGVAHGTSGRVTVYSTRHGQSVRLTHFRTSRGRDMHVMLIAAQDAADDEDFLDKDIERIDLGRLKSNEGDQSYDIPKGTDLIKFRSVSVYSLRYNTNFGTAPFGK